MKSYKKAHVLLMITSIFWASLSFAQTKDAPLLKSKSNGRKPASAVIYRQSGVPAFEMVQKKGNQVFKVKEIPKLDIGEEKQLEASDWSMDLPAKRELHLKEVKTLQSPAVVSLPTITPLPIYQARKVVDTAVIPQIPVVQLLAAVPDPVLETPNPTMKNLVEIGADEYKMLQALIFLEYQKKFDLAMSLFVELMDRPEFRTQALYHYAKTAYGLGLFSEFRQKMIQVTTETKDLELKKKATETLVNNIKSLETSDIELIEPLVEAFDIDVDTNDAYLLKKAKYYSNKGDLGQLEAALTFIPMKSPLYPEAQLLRAVFNYRQGQVDAAIND